MPESADVGNSVQRTYSHQTVKRVLRRTEAELALWQVIMTLKKTLGVIRWMNLFVNLGVQLGDWFV